MADLGNFDADQVEPSRSFDLMPKGWVEAIIEESDKKETKARDGSYVAVTYQILDQRPEYKGRKLWINLNLDNPNPEAVKIARGQLSSICRAVGVTRPKDSSELHNIPHMILIGQRARKDTGEMQNVINDWKPKDGQTVAASAAPQPGKPAQTAGAGAVPWGPKKAV